MVQGKRVNLIMLLILLLQIMIVLYWGNKKEGYYIDELWSYGLSNSYYEPFLQDEDNYMNQWHDSDFYKNYLMVSGGEAFSYDSVYDNQVHDVHPPLFYMMLHTVCSLFVGKFSKWFGLFVNILFYCGTVWLLYKISGYIIGNDNTARIIPPLLYGISGGALSTVMYIRMYMMLTFWILLFVLLTFAALEDCKKPKVIWIGLAGTVAAGFLTQYYFLIFAFFLSGGYVLWQIYNKRWKKAIFYALSVLGGIGAGILLFPASISHIFLGDKGKESFYNSFQGVRVFLSRLRQYDDIISGEFWVSRKGMDIVIACICAAGILLFISPLRSKIKEWDKAAKVKWCLLLAALFGYFCVVVQISTDIVDRYQFAVYPTGVLVFTAIVYFFFKSLGKEKWIWAPAVLYIFLSIYGYSKGTVNYIEEGYGAALESLNTEYKSTPGIYVTPGDHLVINDCLFLAQQEMTLPITDEQLEELPQRCEGMLKNNLVLYVNIYYEEYETAQKVADLLGYQTVSLLYDNTFTQIYVLSR